MIDLKTIRSLVRMMVDHDLSEIDLEDQGEKVRIKRGGAAPTAQPHVVYSPPPPAGQPAAAAPTPPAAQPQADDDSGLTPVSSPMVGTFFSSPSPDSAPFVEVGKRIEPGAVVCIIEAMKVFNEIKAEVGGVVEKILVTNGQGVEFGQPLMLLKP